jgi:hypothetical protein
MSGILCNLAGTGQDRGLIVSYVTSIFLGERAANNSYTEVVNIGVAHPDRRILIYHRNDIFSTNPNNPTLSQTCTVNGTLVTRNSEGGRAEGFVASTAFSVYAGNSSLWISDPVPTGTTATLVFNSTARMYWGPLAVMTIINLKNTTPTTATKSSSPWDLTVPAGGLVVFNGRSSGLNAFDAPSTITNATYRFREGTGAPNPTSAPYSGFDYLNTTPTPQSVAFQPNSGEYRYFTFR